MSGLVALFYSDNPADFQAAAGLATLARYPQVVVNAEMATATADSSGRPYASDGMTPVGWLQAEDVECWLYVNVAWCKDSREYGGPGETFRRAQSVMVEQYDAWLRDVRGSRIPVYGGQMWAVDLRNLRYQEWLRQAVRALPGKRLFVDCGFYHVQSYHQGAGGPDADRAAVLRSLYADWRAAGKQVMVNAGWEALEPGATTQVYPFAGCVDGVAIEVPGGQDTAGKAWTLVSYGAPGQPRRLPDLTRLEALVEDWQDMGKAVWLVAKWQRRDATAYTYSPWATFEEHADYWITAAQSMGCSVAVFADNSHAVWRENWTAEWGVGERTEDGGQKTEEERMANCERRIAALERRIADCDLRIAALTAALTEQES